MEVFHDVLYLSEKDAKRIGVRLGYTSWGPIVLDAARRSFQIRGDKGSFAFEKIQKVYYAPGLAKWIFPVWAAGSIAGFIPDIPLKWSLYGTVGTFFALFVLGLFNKHRILGYVCVETETGKHYFRHVRRDQWFNLSDEKTKNDLLTFLRKLT
ncbi:MAG: hypothetical protein RMM53_03160 [Bacteroidia bacterium]|nr:hypothetical protein [Bacteroidia bacterium]MDW8333197.1 hypothetical protein [Bacteroidia bacterium]